MALKFSLILCIFAVSSNFTLAAASPSAPAPSADCSNLILTMADCLSFVSNGSTTAKPEGNCCSGLKTVLKADPACLCEAFRSSAQLGVVLNVTKAVTLPAACKVSAPSATNCALSDAPAAAPAGGSSSSPVSTPTSSDAATPGISSGPQNEISPAPSPSLGNSSAASSSLIPISAIGSLLLPLFLTVYFHSAF